MFPPAVGLNAGVEGANVRANANPAVEYRRFEPIVYFIVSKELKWQPHTLRKSKDNVYGRMIVTDVDEVFERVYFKYYIPGVDVNDILEVHEGNVEEVWKTVKASIAENFNEATFFTKYAYLL